MRPLTRLRTLPIPAPSRVTGAHQSGFTAIELMVVVSIVAILAALAAPSFTPLIERWRVRQAAENLTSSLYFARSEAIKRGGGVALDATGGWDQGWKVTHTQNGATTDLQNMPAPSKLALSQSNTKTKLFVDRWGMMSESDGGAPAVMNFLLTPTGKDETAPSAIRLCLTAGGRIVQKKGNATC